MNCGSQDLTLYGCDSGCAFLPMGSSTAVPSFLSHLFCLLEVHFVYAKYVSKIGLRIADLLADIELR